MISRKSGAMKIGIDRVTLAYKNLTDQIILRTLCRTLAMRMGFVVERLELSCRDVCISLGRGDRAVT